MTRKHHSAHSDSTGAAAAVKRRAPRAKVTPSSELATAAAPALETRAAARREPVVDKEAIARLAYSYWVERGHTGGSPEQDWLRAEGELRSTRAAAALA